MTGRMLNGRRKKWKGCLMEGGGRKIPMALLPLRYNISRYGKSIVAPQFILSMHFCEARVLAPTKIM